MDEKMVNSLVFVLTIAFSALWNGACAGTFVFVRPLCLVLLTTFVNTIHGGEACTIWSSFII